MGWGWDHTNRDRNIVQKFMPLSYERQTSCSQTLFYILLISSNLKTLMLRRGGVEVSVLGFDLLGYGLDVDRSGSRAFALPGVTNLN